MVFLWLVLGFAAIGVVTVVGWLFLRDAFVTIEPGQLGLLVVRGKATDKALLPGRHFEPSFRRLEVVPYPSTELSYRAGDVAPAEPQADDVERGGPPIPAVLGDRTAVSVSVTVRFRIVREMLRSVHERFGAEGLWAIVRDETSRVVADTLRSADVGVDDLFGAARRVLENRVNDDVTAGLTRQGFAVTLCSLHDVDLGRSGEVVQATARTRLELEREEAEAALRLARARNDADLQPYLAGPGVDAALRYRETDVWREVMSSWPALGSVAPGSARPAAKERPIRPTTSEPTPPAPVEAVAESAGASGEQA